MDLSLHGVSSLGVLVRERQGRAFLMTIYLLVIKGGFYLEQISERS